MTKHIYAFKYRLPGATEFCNGMSDHCLEQPEGRGFVIAPFLPHSPMIFIPAPYTHLTLPTSDLV